MRFDSTSSACLLALTAAVGNALYAFGQKKATQHENPFLFGSIALFVGSFFLTVIAMFFDTRSVGSYMAENIKWFGVSGLGYVLLNIGLYFLYRNFGASYYSLYAVLSIATTSILLAAVVFHERMNLYYWVSLGFAGLTILFFLKGQTSKL
ncbi:MAG TPA: EamA family transporter [Pyrinomonadaceae bacterium]|nr:EamA family transporter [Pyrinomonadaceae bacterium]